MGYRETCEGKELTHLSLLYCPLSPSHSVFLLLLLLQFLVIFLRPRVLLSSLFLLSSLIFQSCTFFFRVTSAVLSQG